MLLDPVLLGNILFLALFCSMFAYLMWAVIIGKIGAVKASNYMYFQPVVTLVFSFLILGEKISVIGYTGCAMILLGEFGWPTICRNANYVTKVWRPNETVL